MFSMKTSASTWLFFTLSSLLMMKNTLTSKKMCEKLIKSIVHVVLKILHFLVFSDFVASILDWKMVFKAACMSFIHSGWENMQSGFGLTTAYYLLYIFLHLSGPFFSCIRDIRTLALIASHVLNKLNDLCIFYTVWQEKHIMPK